MPTTIKSVTEAFELLFSAFGHQEFNKSLALRKLEEEELLPLVRTYLLGYFGKLLLPEVAVALSESANKNGRTDFFVDDVAIKFAVRPQDSFASNFFASINEDEMKKILEFDGKAVLVIFDFLENPYSSDELESFMDWPLCRDNRNKYPLNFAYFYFKSSSPRECGLIKKKIKVC